MNPVSRFWQRVALVGPVLLLLCATPLFQLTIGPGETWTTNLKVVNSNAYDMTYYAEVMNFQAQGEDGTGKFTPVVDESPQQRAASLAGWISITNLPIVIHAHESAAI